MGLARLGVPAWSDLAALVIGMQLAFGAPASIGPRLAYATLAFAFLVAGGSYKFRTGFGLRRDLPPLLARLALPLLPLAAFLGDSPSLADAVRRVPLTAGLLLVGRLGIAGIAGFASARRWLGEPTLIVGAGQVGVRVAEVLQSHPERGMTPVGFLDRFDGDGLPLPVLGDVDAVGWVLSEFKVRRVIIAFGGHDDPDLLPVLRACAAATGVALYIVPRFFELGAPSYSFDSDDLWGIPLVRLKPSTLRSVAYRVPRVPPCPPEERHDAQVVPGTVSVVIPAVNEAKNLPWVLSRMPEFVEEIVLVDGASDDGTPDVALALSPKARIVHEGRHGKGAALRVGFNEARGDFIVMLDADGSMDPREIGMFLEPMARGFDFVKGSRSMAGGGSRDLTRLRQLGNFALASCVNRLFRSRFSDLCYGFCAFRKDCLSALELASDGFEIETEMNIHALKAKLRIAEVPSMELPRRHGQSKLRTFRDGRRVLRTVLLERLRGSSPLPLGGIDGSVVLAERPADG